MEVHLEDPFPLRVLHSLGQVASSGGFFDFCLRSRKAVDSAEAPTIPDFSHLQHGSDIISIMMLDPNPSEHPECRYCAGFLRADSNKPDAPWNKTILESRNFVVVPTLGHFIPGWLLVIPREHHLCLGALDDELMSELTAVKRKSEDLLRGIYGAVIKFEHGPCLSVTVGTCVAHAHLHIVPTKEDLRSELASFFRGREIHGLHELSFLFEHKCPYILYEDDAGSAAVYETPLIPSQFMRMLLARKIGALAKYDWRDYFGLEELASFMRHLENAHIGSANGLLAT